MLNDLRYALRTLRRSPIFTLSAIAALALGIGANTAVCSVVYAVLLKPLPFPEPERLVKLSEYNVTEGPDDARVSRGTFADWTARARTVGTIAAHSGIGETLWGSGSQFSVVKSAAVSAELFGVLRVVPILGRTFRPDDDRKLIIGYDLWQRTFGGAPDVIGRAITVEGRFAGEIIGVMPRGFSFPYGADAWANLRVGGPVSGAARRTLQYHAIARLAPGSTLQDAKAEFNTLAAQLAAEQPASNAGWAARVVSLAGTDAVNAQAALYALLGAVGGVLLIGCANVANLLLARSSARNRELSVRIALGAGPGRLARQPFAEALLLATGGTAAGIVLGNWLRAALVRLAPPDVPRLLDAGMSGPLVLFAVGTGLLAAVFIGLAPAIQAARAARRGELRADRRAVTARTAVVRRLFIGVEVAVVVVLLTGAMLFLRTFVSLRAVDLGFDAEQVWSVSTRWPIGRFAPATPGSRMWPRIQTAVDGLIASLESIPGVEEVGLTADVPLNGSPYSGTVWRSDAAGAAALTPPTEVRDRWKADLMIVTPGYFRALGVPVLRGRNFADGDRWTEAQLNASTPPEGGAVIVNQAFVSRYFAGDDPIGRTLILYDDQTFGWSRTIVGVVADVRARAVSEEAAPAAFVPHGQHPDIFLPSLILRSSLAHGALAAAVRGRLAAYDPQLLVQRIQPMDDVLSGALARPRFNLLLVGSVALLGLLLAAVGIYGVVSFLVTERTREIGIRMALGARAGTVVRLVLHEGMAPVLVGSVAGVAASVLLTRGIRSLLFGVTPMDPLSVAIAPALLAFVALAACYLPARRATRVDPLVALREE